MFYVKIIKNNENENLLIPINSPSAGFGIDFNRNLSTRLSLFNDEQEHHLLKLMETLREIDLSTITNVIIEDLNHVEILKSNKAISNFTYEHKYDHGIMIENSVFDFVK